MMKTPWTLVALLAFAALAAGCARSGGTAGADGRIAITVTEDGFVPKVVKVAAGKPVVLVVTRKTEKTCATELVMKDYGIKRQLPLNQPVEIEFTPENAGDIRYACGMDMLTGTVKVQ